MKRNATAPLEKSGPAKKATQETEKPVAPVPLDFEELDSDFRRQVREAVAAAMVPDTKQPLILELQDSDVEDTAQYAWYPASQALGEWLVQALELLSWKAPSVHLAMTAAIHDAPDDVVAETFRGYLDNSIRRRADLGRFLLVLTPEEDADGEEDLFVQRTTLNFGLYHHRCRYDCGHGGESSVSDTDSEEDNDDV